MKNIIILTITLFMLEPNAGSFASTVFNQGAGTHFETIIGVVESVNRSKNAFVVYDKYEGTSTTVLTDSKTIASLVEGQTVRVIKNVTSPMALSVTVVD